MAFDLSVCCNLRYVTAKTVIATSWLSTTSHKKPQGKCKENNTTNSNLRVFSRFFVGDFARSTCCTNC
jgi:hypothetical protein